MELANAFLISSRLLPMESRENAGAEGAVVVCRTVA
jgi:hypothetical protein